VTAVADPQAGTRAPDVADDASPHAPDVEKRGDDRSDAGTQGAQAGRGEDSSRELQLRIEELEDLWRRALADLDNVRKRVADESARQRAAERERVAAEWLPVLDNLDLALEHAGADGGAVVEGVRAVRDQAIAVLSRLGYPRYGEVGVAFDPTRHEAVATVPASPEFPPGTVVHVVRPGYGADEHPLRPAAVVVATRGE
jgi:molecular chaperone GrpE